LTGQMRGGREKTFAEYPARRDSMKSGNEPP